MSRQKYQKQELLRAAVAAISTLAAAATFGFIASGLSYSHSEFRPPIQNPFDNGRASQ